MAIVATALYLDEFERRTAGELMLDAALAELRRVRLVDGCWSLPWRLRLLAEDQETAPDVAMALRCLRDDLEVLA